MNTLSMKDSRDLRSEQERPASDLMWQRLWFSTMEKPWSSMAVVPADPDTSVEEVAAALAEIGHRCSSRPISVVSACGVATADVQAVVAQITSLSSRGEQVLVTFDSVLDHPAAIPILRVTTAALVVVRTGQSRLSSVRRLAELIGPERVRGSLVLE